MLNILDSFVKTLDWEDGAIVSADIVGWFGLDGISDGAAQAIADGIGGGFFAADVALFSYSVATSWQSYNSR